MNSLHESVMTQLAKRHDVILSLIDERNVHYLDLPLHGNVGDLLIMQGTLAFLNRNNISITRLGMYFNYSTEWANKSDVLVLHGGGNFGDIYGPFQKFREQVISACPDNRIIILPQSIHFDNQKRYEQCCAVLQQHPDLHICVRDSISAELASRMSPNVYLLPDMAHQLWPLTRTKPTRLPLLKLRRRDSEASQSTNSEGIAFDWQDLVGQGWTFFLSQVAERSMYHATRIGINKPFANWQAELWIRQANRFVERATSLFSEYECIETDRLHGHLLACLLSIPNKVGDNAYGKNSRYINEWTKGSDLVQLIDNENLFASPSLIKGAINA